MTQWSRIILAPLQSEAMDTKTKMLWWQARADAGNALEFAAFRTNPPDNELYFSPAASAFALSIGATPCARPLRTDVSQCNSDVRAADACFGISPPTNEELQKAWSRGYRAGDEGKGAIANPYEPGLQQLLHERWEEGRLDGIRDH